MYFIPNSRPLLKIWGANYGTKLGPIGARINEPADMIAKQQANMQQLVSDIANTEQARLELQRLTAVMNATVKMAGDEAREYVKRIKTNPLFTDADAQELQVISTKAIQDVTGYKPVLTARQIGALIHLLFQKHGADSMNAYGRLHGEADFNWLGNAKLRPFIFTPPAIPVGTTLLYEFYVIPTLDNVETGLRSNILAFSYTG